jgi:hypothetical protein
MKKWLLISLTVVGLLALGIGCVPTNQPAATPQTSPIQDLQNWRTAMDTWKTTVADPAIAKANALGSQPNYDSAIASIKATESEKDQKIADLAKQITDLNNWKATQGTVVAQQQTTAGQQGLQGQNVQFTPGMPPTGGIPTSPSGGIVSQVNWVQGTSQTYTNPTGSSGNVWYTQRLMNQSTAIQYVRPMINIGVSSQSGYSNYGNAYFAGLNVSISSSQGTLSGVYTPPTWWSSAPTAAGTAISGLPISSISQTSPVQPASGSFSAVTTTPLTFSLAPGLGQVTSSLLIMPVSGLGDNLGEYYIAPGQYVDITVMIQGLYTNVATMWSISASQSSHM